MIRKKIKLYYKSIIRHLFKILYGEILLPKTTKALLKKIKINELFFRSFKNEKYQIYVIKNARIYTDNNENVAIIKNDLILPYISFQQINGILCGTKFNTVLKKGTPAFKKKIIGNVFNLCQGASGNNYSHFLFDILPKIYLLSSKIDLKEIDHFYVSEPKQWQIKIFGKLGISKSKLLSSKKYNHIIADKVYAVDHPWYKKGNIHHGVKEMPSWIFIKNRKVFLKEYNKKFSKKIFLDRSDSNYNHCQINDLKNLIKFVQKNKFKSYQAGLLSFDDQINLFNNASIVLGAHGASLANIVFCKPGTKIIEIIPADHPNRKCERISKILKLKYFRIQTPPNNNDSNYPFKIDLDKKNFDLIEKIIDL